jgi:hypothetical protein
MIIDLVAWGYSPIDLTVPDPEYDLVYYERQMPPDDVIYFDWVQMDISQSCNGGDWYTALNWGDGLSYNNGHLGFFHPEYPETDNLSIRFSELYGNIPSLKTGIAIDLDDPALRIPPGTYSCILIYSPVNWPNNDGSEVDALEIILP